MVSRRLEGFLPELGAVAGLARLDLSLAFERLPYPRCNLLGSTVDQRGLFLREGSAMSDEVALYREFARQCVELAQQREMAPHSSLLIAMATEWVEHADREIENGAEAAPGS